MIVNVDLPKYKYLKKGLQNYCLLRQIVRKQYEHCKIYPNDVKLIRSLYGHYPTTGLGSPEVERFIRFNENFLNYLIGNHVTKRSITNLFNGFYSFGYDSSDPLYFERLKERLDAINFEIIKSLNTYYDFKTDKVNFSNYSIPEYFREAYTKGKERSRFNEYYFMNSKLYKSYIIGNYHNLSIAFDTYDIKLNQDFWDKYTIEDFEQLISEINEQDCVSSTAGIDRFDPLSLV